MKYTLEQKKEVISSKPDNVDVKTYCDNIGIAYSSYYKWRNEIALSDKVFVDVTNVINEENNNFIDLEISNTIIHVSNDYDESHLLKILNTLKKI